MRRINISEKDSIEISHCSECPFCSHYHGGIACEIYLYLYDGTPRPITTEGIPSWCELPKAVDRIDYRDNQDAVMNEAGHAKYEAV